ncbi:MAG: YraN family protein [Paenibacillaceae bacterium]
MSEKEKLDPRKMLGEYGERLALEYLNSLNYVNLETNWRCRSGELDIIAEDVDILVFVEVRTRRMTGRFGSPQESVDFRKQRKVRETAQVYLHQHHKHNSKIRFDLVSVELNLQGEFIRLDHLKHAF